jgi:hypothetical protein
LATQAVIATRSKAKFYDGGLDENELPEDLGATERDEIGLVRAICVKVRLLFISLAHDRDPRLNMKARSSAQRKEAFKAVQYRRKIPAVQLLLDMKVRWSSTFIMLTRAESRREVCMHTYLL